MAGYAKAERLRYQQQKRRQRAERELKHVAAQIVFDYRNPVDRQRLKERVVH